MPTNPGVAHFDTIWSADSVEFCPHPDATDIFVCGTYQLQQDPTPNTTEDAYPDPEHELEEDESNPISEDTVTQTRKPQTRLGKCLVFEVTEYDDCNLYVLIFSHEVCGRWRCGDTFADRRYGMLSRHLQEFSMPAILDMKWSAPFAFPISRYNRTEGTYRCFTTQARDPLLAVADAEGHISLHDWDRTEVRHFYTYTQINIRSR